MKNQNEKNDLAREDTMGDSLDSRTASEDTVLSPSVSPDQVTNQPQRKPWLWVHPNPAGVSRELMGLEEFFEFVRDWPTYGASGECIDIELVWMTDAEVEALPDV